MWWICLGSVCHGMGFSGVSLSWDGFVGDWFAVGLVSHGLVCCPAPAQKFNRNIQPFLGIFTTSFTSTVFAQNFVFTIIKKIRALAICVSLSVCLLSCDLVCLFSCQAACLFVFMSLCRFVIMYLCPSVSVSDCLYVSLSVCHYVSL